MPMSVNQEITLNSAEELEKKDERALAWFMLGPWLTFFHWARETPWRKRGTACASPFLGVLSYSSFIQLLNYKQLWLFNSLNELSIEDRGRKRCRIASFWPDTQG